MSEAATIATIYRYPVKGLSAEPLARVAVAPRECLPHDRRFAIALAATRFDPERPEWLSKTHFIMLMRDEKLARLKTSFDPQTGELTIEHAGIVAVQARLGEPEGCRVVITPQEPQGEERLGITEEEWPKTPEALAEWLKWLDSIEPVEMTPEEEADWLAWRQKIKEYELANFGKRVEGLFE